MMNDENSNNCFASICKPFETSTPIPMKKMNNNNDSAYSSFASPQNSLNTVSSNLNRRSPSQNATNSPQQNKSNDEELEKLFFSMEVSNFPDGPLRRSLRSSPWTMRPMSAPLQEENEDEYDKEPEELPIMKLEKEEKSYTGISRHGRLSITETDIRNELIAIKLKAVADKLPLSRSANSSFRIRRYSGVFETTNSISSASSVIYRTKSNRCSPISSFTEIIPGICGSTIDVARCLYSIYRFYTHMESNNNNVTISKSGSTVSFVETTHKITQSRRIRSYTE